MAPKISNTEPPPRIDIGEIWGRKRIVFLCVSSALVVSLIWWASEVMLPFVLAVIIAYVLTPLVQRVESRGVARSVAILLV